MEAGEMPSLIRDGEKACWVELEKPGVLSLVFTINDPERRQRLAQNAG